MLHESCQTEGPSPSPMCPYRNEVRLYSAAECLHCAHCELRREPRSEPKMIAAVIDVFLPPITPQPRRPYDLPSLVYDFGNVNSAILVTVLTPLRSCQVLHCSRNGGFAPVTSSTCSPQPTHYPAGICVSPRVQLHITAAAALLPL